MLPNIPGLAELYDQAVDVTSALYTDADHTGLIANVLESFAGQSELTKSETFKNTKLKI